MLVSLVMAGSALAQESAFAQSSNFRKLDLRAQTAWRDAMRAGDKDKRFSCLVKVEKKMSQRQQNALVGTGFKPGTIIQTIVTGTVAVKDVPALAGLGFVRAVELARPLGVKNDPGYQKYGAPRSVKVRPKAKKKPVTPKPEAKAKEAQPTEVPQVKAVEPVKQIEGTTSVPIYQTAPAPVVDRPNMPPTSPEIPSEGPAIAPVDQANPVIQPAVTPTQPVVEKPKPEPQPQPQYAPTQ
jgi:hypothetical protein